MRIRIGNTGLVRSASLDLKGLTVIMGPNNSGKSTVAIALYAAVKAASAMGGGLFFFGRTRAARNNAFDSIERALAEASEAEKVSASKNSEQSIPLIRIIAEAVLEAYGDSVGQELQKAFGSQLNTLPTRNPASGRVMPMKISIESEEPAWSIDVSISVKGKISTKITSLADEIGINAERLAPYIGQSGRDFYRVQILASEIAAPLMRDFPRRAHYLPAARAGLLQSHRLVAAAMLQSSTFAGMSEFSMPSLSGVVTDFISEIILDEGREVSQNSFSRLAETIERGLLFGSVSKQTVNGAYPEIQFTDAHGGDYPIHRTSSMVSELAPIVLLLKRNVARGELLIVEEPESHLHPQAQVQLARILFRASRLGLTVFLTTHSEFFVAQLNNEIRAEAELKRRGKLANRRQVSDAAFWVDVREDGSYLEGLNIDRFDGIPDESFSAVTDTVYEQQIAQQQRLLSAASAEDE